MTKHFPFRPEKKSIKIENFSPDMKESKPEKRKSTENLLMDQTRKQRKIIHYRVRENLLKTWKENFILTNSLPL